ncbi:hypothetical protein DPM12_06505 [Phytoactinopolyspora halophila]|uniref:Uncharacterized protein n=1 Tax=Phytoactinopolyspora halophila TaxID=1981511 RepID=A0A329QZI0_9ACTN|nr:hypothetical protein DPM12_06505 [Phytoactinopolyspora halophila]
MQYRALGRTGIKVRPYALGAEVLPVAQRYGMGAMVSSPARFRPRPARRGCLRFPGPQPLGTSAA